MNERFRLPVAVLISLLIHFALLLWIVQLVKVRPPESGNLMQVYLQNNVQYSGRQTQLATGTGSLSIDSTQPQSIGKPQVSAKPPSAVARQHQAPGLFRFQTPSASQQAAQMNAMHLVQLAQQREMHRASVMAAMSGLAVQLRPIVKARIVCVQQANLRTDCTPEPDKKVRPLLEQFFSLATEARQLGIADNPVHIDFGAEQSVSVKLLP